MAITGQSFREFNEGLRSIYVIDQQMKALEAANQLKAAQLALDENKETRTKQQDALKLFATASNDEYKQILQLAEDNKELLTDKAYIAERDKAFENKRLYRNMLFESNNIQLPVETDLFEIAMHEIDALPEEFKSWSSGVGENLKTKYGLSDQDIDKIKIIWKGIDPTDPEDVRRMEKQLETYVKSFVDPSEAPTEFPEYTGKEDPGLEYTLAGDMLLFGPTAILKKLYTKAAPVAKSAIAKAAEKLGVSTRTSAGKSIGRPFRVDPLNPVDFNYNDYLNALLGSAVGGARSAKIGSALKKTVGYGGLLGGSLAFDSLVDASEEIPDNFDELRRNEYDQLVPTDGRSNYFGDNFNQIVPDRFGNLVDPSYTGMSGDVGETSQLLSPETVSQLQSLNSGMGGTGGFLDFAEGLRMSAKAEEFIQNLSIVVEQLGEEQAKRYMARELAKLSEKDQEDVLNALEEMSQ
jgi:hypothetical protein